MNNKYLKYALNIFLSLVVLHLLYACNAENTGRVDNSNTTSRMPSAVQKIIIGDGETLHAYVTIDGDTTNRTEMNIDVDNGTASVTLNGLSKKQHAILITYEFTDAIDTLVVATASKDVDLSSGSTSLSFTGNEYDVSYDEDGDGASNAGELATGSNPRLATPPIAAVEPVLSFTSVKVFNFSWTDVGDATHYKLLENPDGGSGFTQVGSDISHKTQAFDHIVPLYARLNARYIVQSCNLAGCTDSAAVSVSGSLVSSIGYVKASNTQKRDRFGNALSLSSDGTTLAVGAFGESSNTGAVYVYSHSGDSWVQQAYIKASNAEAGDRFGRSVSLSGDGNILAVGASGEDSDGFNGDQTNNGADSSGAVYVYNRNGSSWLQQAYIKASNTGAGDSFGFALSLSSDGSTLAVGATGEDSSATNINGDQINSGAFNSGAVYVYNRNDSNWLQQAYIKASNTNLGDVFGSALSLSSDGTTLAVGAGEEGSSATGINGDQRNNEASGSGAVYVYSRRGDSWLWRAYIKASNTNSGDGFGYALSLSGDGTTLAVGARGEGSNATGINGDQSNNTAGDSGAVYVYSRSGDSWLWRAYIKASNTNPGDFFGYALSLSSDGTTLAVGAGGEDSNTTGINGDQINNGASGSGAVYVYNRSGFTGDQQAYIKASNTQSGDFFGSALSLSGDGTTLVVGAADEGSNATGINGDQTNNDAFDSGAVYVY